MNLILKTVILMNLSVKVMFMMWMMFMIWIIAMTIIMRTLMEAFLMK